MSGAQQRRRGAGTPRGRDSLRLRASDERLTTKVVSPVNTKHRPCMRDSNTMRPGAAKLRALAVIAHVDPRTIEREWRAAHGQDTPARGDAGERARAALREAGLIETSQGRPPCI